MRFAQCLQGRPHFQFPSRLSREPMPDAAKAAHAAAGACFADVKAKKAKDLVNVVPPPISGETGSAAPSLVDTLSSEPEPPTPTRVWSFTIFE